MQAVHTSSLLYYLLTKTYTSLLVTPRYIRTGKLEASPTRWSIPDVECTQEAQRHYQHVVSEIPGLKHIPAWSRLLVEFLQFTAMMMVGRKCRGLLVLFVPSVPGLDFSRKCVLGLFKQIHICRYQMRTRPASARPIISPHTIIKHVFLPIGAILLTNNRHVQRRRSMRTNSRRGRVRDESDEEDEQGESKSDEDEEDQVNVISS